jgi:hypothetical protein
VLGGTLRGAAIIAACNPLEMRPHELALWDRVRYHTWSMALHVSERESDRAAVLAALHKVEKKE